MFVKVLSQKDGFRRAGRGWSTTEQVAEVTEEEFEALQAEPVLAVAEISAEEFAAGGGEAAPAKPTRGKRVAKD